MESDGWLWLLPLEEIRFGWEDVIQAEEGYRSGCQEWMSVGELCA